MKYAFIALVAIYLIIYGCSPDSSEKTKESHEQTTQTTVKNAHDSEKAAVAVEDQQKPAVPALKEQAEVVKTTEQPAEAAKETDPILSFKVVEQAPSEQAAEPQQLILPCGRVITQTDNPENAPPCLKMQTPELQDTAAAAGTEQELAAALQKMVKTTNDMVLATRQLVIATQEILNASKKAEETPPVEQSAEGQEAAPAQQ
jgi:hypothetical protein